MTEYIPTLKTELAYATADNPTQAQVYHFTDAFLRYGTVKKLKQAEQELNSLGFGLIIWDSFRPIEAQAKLCQLLPDTMAAYHPVTGDPIYSRGNTVALTLRDLQTGQEVAMPTKYGDLTASADRDYTDCSEEAAANAMLLEGIMKKYGFTACAEEWWRFTDETEYSIEEHFNPAISPIWSANCSDYISLRKSPSPTGTVLVRINKNATMELIGWHDKYAKVRYKGIEGYVLANYIMPQADSYLLNCLKTVSFTNVYTYDQMTADIATLQERHPDVLTVSSIGTSELGRDIPVLCIGNLEAAHHVLLQGAIHGREHQTAWLLMAMAEYWLDHGILGYGDVCYHIIPMSNPDGVIISQTQTLNDAQREIYHADKANGFASPDEAYYASRWKANGTGVDVNRNFSSGWETIDDRTGPSSEFYQGEEPFSSAEAKALRDYTMKYTFDATVSYHATGSLIYYEYGDKTEVNAESGSLGLAVSGPSGYRLADSVGVDAGGYKDWAIDEMEIPSITIEIGVEEAPLVKREIYSIFARNYQLLPTLARWVQE